MTTVDNADPSEALALASASLGINLDTLKQLAFEDHEGQQTAAIVNTLAELTQKSARILELIEGTHRAPKPLGRSIEACAHDRRLIMALRFAAEASWNTMRRLQAAKGEATTSPNRTHAEQAA